MSDAHIVQFWISLAKLLPGMKGMYHIVCFFLHHYQVRVNALRCFGDLVSSLDKQAVLDILQTIQRCTAVDRSAPTLMCTLGVASSIYKQVKSLLKIYCIDNSSGRP